MDDIEDIDLTDIENLDIETVILEVTHENNIYNTRSPIKDRVDEGVLDTREWFNVIDKLHTNGVEQVVISGGEPTVRDDFHDILGYAINVIGDVTVRTNGCTRTPLSTYDCDVEVYIDSMESGFNNRVFRMTDPDRFKIDAERGLVDTSGGGACKFCGESCDGINGIRMHLKHNHPEEAVEMFNEGVEEGPIDKVDGWEGLRDAIKNNDPFSWRFYAESEDVQENALRKVMQKIDKLEGKGAGHDNDLTIRSAIYEENDIESIMTYAEKVGANTVFTPLRPAGKAKDNYRHQVPSPGRMKEVIGKVSEIGSMLRTEHTVNSPVYKAFNLRQTRQMIQNRENKSRSDLEMLYKIESELEKYWGRGRVSEIGVSSLTVRPDGETLPSPYLRGKDYRCGNILESDWTDILEGLAEFNQVIQSDDDFDRGAENMDVRRKSVACDLEVVLNYPYEK